MSRKIEENMSVLLHRAFEQFSHRCNLLREYRSICKDLKSCADSKSGFRKCHVLAHKLSNLPPDGEGVFQALSGAVKDKIKQGDAISRLKKDLSRKLRIPLRQQWQKLLKDEPDALQLRSDTSMKNFVVLKRVTRGALGAVFLARRRETNDTFAIKVMKKADMYRKNIVRRIKDERRIMETTTSQARHVVQLYYSFQTKNNLYLVMEYLNGGDLASLLDALGALDEDLVRKYVAEVLLGLECLHSIDIIHRDIKPDNILIGKDGHVKLIDFGLAAQSMGPRLDSFVPNAADSDRFKRDASDPKAEVDARTRRFSYVGTPDYLPPEIIKREGHDYTADYWSLGVVMFELLSGHTPFHKGSIDATIQAIVASDIDWSCIDEDVSAEARDLIEKFLRPNPANRIGSAHANDIRGHPWFSAVNWNTLLDTPATFVPHVDDEHDTSYFHDRSGEKDLDIADVENDVELMPIADEDEAFSDGSSDSDVDFYDTSWTCTIVGNLAAKNAEVLKALSIH
jgi:serine/threonine protein kinase